MFTDSAFYSPKFHPSVAEQVEMAHKLSSSLYDDGNKTSKGQDMFLKRSKKSGKWVTTNFVEGMFLTPFLSCFSLGPWTQQLHRKQYNIDSIIVLSLFWLLDEYLNSQVHYPKEKDILVILFSFG